MLSCSFAGALSGGAIPTCYTPGNSILEYYSFKLTVSFSFAYPLLCTIYPICYSFSQRVWLHICWTLCTACDISMINTTEMSLLREEKCQKPFH